jgi:DNA adenine methylase
VEGLSFIRERLRGVVIEQMPAEELILKQDGPTTLHYIDPPYLPSTRTTKGVHRYNVEMTEEEHRSLADLLHNVRGHVILSGYPSPLYEELYRGWKKLTRSARADGARARTEVLWIKP